MRIAIIGHSQHGKGTVSEYLAINADLKYTESTSQVAASVVYSELGDIYAYRHAQECWDDRHNHRDEWASIIWLYNQPSGTQLYREMLFRNDIIDGIRKSKELQNMRDSGLIDLVVWVDASKRVEPEPRTSCQVTVNDADVIIDNNGTPQELAKQLNAFILNHVTGANCG